MKDTVIGVIGAFVIVGSMTGAITFLEEEEIEDGAPAALDQTRWVGEDCRSVTLAWEVEAGAMEGFVEPWTVREGPGEMGEFRLVAWECSENTVNNVDEGSQAGALALVMVDEPENERNVSVGDWRASPEIVRVPGGAVGDAFVEHGFPVSSGTVSVDVTDALAAAQVEALIETGDGTVEVSGVFMGVGEQVEEQSAIVAPGDDVFSVLVGSASGESREAFDVSVESSGETWLDRLGLGEPEEAWFVSEKAWRVTVWDLPFDADPPADA